MEEWMAEQGIYPVLFGINGHVKPSDNDICILKIFAPHAEIVVVVVAVRGWTLLHICSQ